MTETKFVSLGGRVDEPYMVWDYVQYFNGKPVARFKIKEPWHGFKKK